MRNPVVSVVMPCLNGMPYLPAAIASVREAFPSDILEIIVADGGSRDGSAEYLRAQNLTLLEGPDGSLYAALNKAVAAARGDYILWLNCDDALTRAAATLLSRAIEDRADIATGEAEIQALGTVTWRSDHTARQMTTETLLFGVPTINSRLVSRGFIERVGPFRDDIGLGADRHFLLRLLRLKSKRTALPQVVYRYQAHSLSRTMGGSWATYRSVHEAHLATAAALRLEVVEVSERALLEAFECASRLALVRASLFDGAISAAFQHAVRSLATQASPLRWRKALALHRLLRGQGAGW